MSVAKPSILALPAPSMPHSLSGLPGSMFSSTMEFVEALAECTPGADEPASDKRPKSTVLFRTGCPPSKPPGDCADPHIPQQYTPHWSPTAARQPADQSLISD